MRAGRLLGYGVSLVGVVAVSHAAYGGLQRLLVQDADSTDGDPRYIGRHPILRSLHAGMSRQQVKALLGSPQHRSSSDSVGPGYVLLPAKHEEWRYAPPGWHGEIVIYFDESQKVRTVSWGFG